MQVPAWIIPAMMTAFMLVAMLRPVRERTPVRVEAEVLRGFWLIPILAVWLVYLAAFPGGAE